MKDARDILKVRNPCTTLVEQTYVPFQDSNSVQQYFSSERLPTLWRALPAIEQLQTAWEAKRDHLHFARYRGAINDGLAKLQKYYSRFNEKPSFILALGKSPLGSPYQTQPPPQFYTHTTN